MKRGSARFRRGRLLARARFGTDGAEDRVEVAVPWATTLEQATERAHLIGEIAGKLLEVGRPDLVKGTARELAACDTPERLARTRKAIAIMLKDERQVRIGRDVTVKQWGQRYTSGELSRAHPDHVREKDFSKDAGRLRMYVYPIIGDVPLRAMRVEHGNAVMRKLPAHLSSASRRHVAQSMMRLMHLAVFPGSLITASPLPRGWLPRISSRRHYSCLYPREEAMLLEHAPTPIAFRLLCGVLNREGLRLTELWDSDWYQWNLVEGTFLATKTKTNDPRIWAIAPDVLRAMVIHRDLKPDNARPFAELDELIGDRTKTAEYFRAALKAAGVTRAELFATTAHTGKLRAHDMRATFVTVSLAQGRTETWIRDRTGHKSTAMIDRYRRTARQFEELKLGPLAQLDVALGLATDGQALTPTGGQPGGEHSMTQEKDPC